MTEAPDTPTPEAPTEVEAGTPDTDTDTDTETGSDGNGNREAARYRTKLREVEAERDSLTEALDAYRQRDAVTLAEEAGLADGSDLLSSTSLADLLAADGTVDGDLVKAATAALLESKPHWQKPKPDFGAGDRGIDVSSKSEASWLDVLRPTR